ncbi:hypothetical protein EV2_025960 [Malus domestica]
MGKISLIRTAEIEWNPGNQIGGSDQALSGSMKSWRPSREKKVKMSFRIGPSRMSVWMKSFGSRSSVYLTGNPIGKLRALMFWVVIWLWSLEIRIGFFV